MTRAHIACTLILFLSCPAAVAQTGNYSPPVRQPVFRPQQPFYSQQQFPQQGGFVPQPAAPAVRPRTSINEIRQWFGKYDQVRRKAQMNPQERKRADALLSKAISILIPGDEKVATRKLLRSLCARYKVAAEAMKNLPLYPETEVLHRGYYQYFSTAHALFSDYLRVQDNVLVADASGTPVAKSLLPRKQGLEQLDRRNKGIDTQLRAQFNIAPYRY